MIAAAEIGVHLEIVLILLLLVTGGAIQAFLKRR